MSTKIYKSEEEFLKDYDSNAFEKLSVTADILILSVADEETGNYRKLSEKKFIDYELISIPFAKYLNKRCKSCHKLLYGAAYSWALIKEKVKRYKSNDGYELEYMLKYQIIFTCPHCGHVGSEKMDFTSKYNYSECEAKRLNYCMKKFGH